ncbi:GNAT family N-acetyltransferase [Streptomyces sp. M19]
MDKIQLGASRRTGGLADHQGAVHGQAHEQEGRAARAAVRRPVTRGLAWPRRHADPPRPRPGHGRGRHAAGHGRGPAHSRAALRRRGRHGRLGSPGRPGQHAEELPRRRRPRVRHTAHARVDVQDQPHPGRRRPAGPRGRRAVCHRARNRHRHRAEARLRAAEGPDLGVAVAKVHGLAVAEQARGQGLAAALLKRAWQVHHQLGYFLLYGSYEAERDLGAFYARCGYTVLDPGEGFSLEPIGVPFGIHAGPNECVFTRWRPRR